MGREYALGLARAVASHHVTARQVDDNVVVRSGQPLKVPIGRDVPEPACWIDPTNHRWNGSIFEILESWPVPSRFCQTGASPSRWAILVQAVSTGRKKHELTPEVVRRLRMDADSVCSC